jgi:hypothetical protein
MPVPLTKVISVQTTPEEKAAIAKHAERDQRSMSAWLRHAARKAMEEAQEAAA